MSKLRDAAQQALEALEWADNAMYEGTPIQANTQKAITALRTALAEHPEQEPGNWIVYNSGAEVASGLSLAEALEYLTPERLARQWCAVCVVDQSNLPKTPQPAKQPLIDDEICDSWEFITGHQIQFGPSSEGRQMYLSTDEVIEFARAIERAHGIGEHE